MFPKVSWPAARRGSSGYLEKEASSADSFTPQSDRLPSRIVPLTAPTKLHSFCPVWMLFIYLQQSVHKSNFSCFPFHVGMDEEILPLDINKFTLPASMLLFLSSQLLRRKKVISPVKSQLVMVFPFTFSKVSLFQISSHLYSQFYISAVFSPVSQKHILIPTFSKGNQITGNSFDPYILLLQLLQFIHSLHI